ncbi:hypothetical protein [Sulfurimonas sp. HSL-1716]|uniref:hypothetical protein n=1 Tax=Hydrocurvibacter sulfurireducens TaxID=3131937 RepID=UPI0031F84555
MNTFPLVPTGLSTQRIKPVSRAKYDAGYEQTAPKNTRALKKFTLSFGALTNAEADTLDNFFVVNQGVAFEFIHPIEDISYIVRFSEDSISFEQFGKDYQSTQIVIEEI